MKVNIIALIADAAGLITKISEGKMTGFHDCEPDRCNYCGKMHPTENCPHAKADEEKRQKYNKLNREKGGALGPYAPPRHKSDIGIWTYVEAEPIDKQLFARALKKALCQEAEPSIVEVSEEITTKLAGKGEFVAIGFAAAYQYFHELNKRTSQAK